MNRIFTRVVRKEPFFSIYYKGLWSPKNPSIQYLLNKYSATKGKVNFVQIGANDGINDDPIRKFIRRDKWNGILVEPIKAVFDKLKVNYKGYEDQLVFENVAISNVTGSRNFYYVKDFNDEIPEWVTVLSSFNKQVTYELKEKFPSIEIACEEMNCITFNDLLKKNNMSEVQLITIDTEGHDFEIIKEIDFKTTKPDLIVFEHRHLNNDDYNSCIELLKSNGYQIFKEDFDTMGFQSSLNLL